MRDQFGPLRQLLLPMLTVVGAIGLLALLVYLIRNWWRESDDSAGGDHQLLSDYREMHLRGELSDEEYRIIKSRMASRLGKGTSPAPGAAPIPASGETRPAGEVVAASPPDGSPVDDGSQGTATAGG
jgi:hypothetical protein